MNILQSTLQTRPMLFLEHLIHIKVKYLRGFRHSKLLKVKHCIEKYFINCGLTLFLGIKPNNEVCAKVKAKKDFESKVTI